MTGAEVVLCETVLGAEDCAEMVSTALKKDRSQKDMRDFIFAMQKTQLFDHIFNKIFEAGPESALRPLLLHKFAVVFLEEGEILNKRREKYFGCVLSGVIRMKNQKPKASRSPGKTGMGNSGTPNFRLKVPQLSCDRKTKELRNIGAEIAFRKRALDSQRLQIGLRFTKLIEKVEKKKAKQVEKSYLGDGRTLVFPGTTAGGFFPTSPFFGSSGVPSIRIPMTERAENRSLARLAFPSDSQKRLTQAYTPSGEDLSEPAQNRFSVNLRPSEFLRRFHLGHSHELRPGDIFDQIFCGSSEKASEISAKVASVVLVVRKSEVTEMFANVRSDNDTRLLRQFMEAFNLPPQWFYSERLCQFVAKSKVL